MFHSASKPKKPRNSAALFGLALACLAAGPFCDSSAAATAREPESLDAGFRYMYNLNFSAAHRTFEAWQQSHPNDPLGAASNAAAYLFSEFERLQILNINLFADDDQFKDRAKQQPDPNIKIAFENELARADKIAAKNLSESPRDRNSLFARVLTDGLRGDYAVLIENKNRSGLNYLKSSRASAEKLIAMDPAYFDAYLAIGIENYVLGARSAPMRWMLRISGAQTNKDKGVSSLKMTAEYGRFLAPYARLLLAIAALRDHDWTTAKKLLTELARQFPQNPLYQNELARLEQG